MINSFYLLVLVFILSFTYQSSAENQQKSQLFLRNDLKLGIYDFEPHMISRENVSKNPEGAIIDYFKDLQQGTQINFIPRTINFARIMIELERGNIDLVPMIAKTAEREKKYIFSDKPIYTTRSAVILLKDHPIKEIKKLSELKGYKLGHVSGSIIPKYIEENGITIDAISGENYFLRNLSRLKEKRIDGAFIPTKSSGEYQLKINNLLGDYKIIEIPNEPLNLYIVFSLKTDKSIIKKVNDEMSKYNYGQFLQKYLSH